MLPLALNDLENTQWRDSLGEYVKMTEDGAVVLSLADAIRLVRIHSPEYQKQFETLYLSALDIHDTRLRVQHLPKSSEKTETQEQLDGAKNKLKTNLRAFHRYRQGFYTHVAIGELGVNELAAVADRGTHELEFVLTSGRGGLGGGGAGTVGGFVGLRNCESSWRFSAVLWPSLFGVSI